MDDDDESVKFGFGASLPVGVASETPATTTVRITDDDDPEVKVSYSQATYTVAEGGTVTITVELDADPERTVVIPLTHAPKTGAGSADYSSLPESLTFDSAIRPRPSPYPPPRTPWTTTARPCCSDSAVRSPTGWPRKPPQPRR